ncbi:MAG TPA: RNA polymerase sigma factor region1.1 domain-containing protein, partial [Patescibacteria group bacterium]|nr:RNA polymerase sigma factor region1.1 domain-containing protein [Patescibacteria group bacterium]
MATKPKKLNKSATKPAKKPVTKSVKKVAKKPAVKAVKPIKKLSSKKSDKAVKKVTAGSAKKPATSSTKTPAPKTSNKIVRTPLKKLTAIALDPAQQEKLDQQLAELMKKGKARGFVTEAEILHVFPSLENEISTIEHVMDALEAQGIELVDQEVASVWEQSKGAEDDAEPTGKKKKDELL